MGGNALNKYGVFTKRKDTITFNYIGKTLSDKLYTDFNLETAIVKCYHEKNDHGDLDLLIKITDDFSSKNINLKDYIQETFSPNAIHYNAGVYSFDYEDFQIDFISIKESNWEIANTYYAFDPLSNIMGKTFHKFNLSYGWEGLYYKFRNFNGVNSHNILISKDPKKILDFGGYDYDRYCQGFKTLEEIFQYVISSKYFNTETLQFENLNQIDRKRNRKRKSFNEFLLYIKDNYIKSNYFFNENKDSYIPMINDYFPEANLLEELKILNEKNNINKILAEKFNGNIIMTWIPDLQGKELGNVIRLFKLELGDDYDNFILNNDIKIICKKFMFVYYKHIMEIYIKNLE